jgi:hypothetical protein
MKPPYYTQGSIEFIEAVEARGWGREWVMGNALKYVWRAGEKDGTNEAVDIQKAIWYLSRRLEQIHATPKPA